MSRHITFIYMYLYLIWERFLFFRTKLIVQAYDEVGHRVQVLAVCSGLTHLIRGSLRGFSPAGQSLTSSEVDKVIAQLAIGHCQRRDSAPRQVSQTGQSNWFHQFALD